MIVTLNIKFCFVSATKINKVVTFKLLFIYLNIYLSNIF